MCLGRAYKLIALILIVLLQVFGLAAKPYLPASASGERAHNRRAVIGGALNLRLDSLTAKTRAGVVHHASPEVVSDSLSLSRRHPSDTANLTIYERNKRFYDSLEARSHRNAFSRLLHDVLIRPERDTSKQRPEIVDESVPFRPFKGMFIKEIEIIPGPIFDRPRSYVQKAITATHVRTHVSTIRQDLVFKVGDNVDPERFATSLRILRSRSYFYEANIVVEPIPDEPNTVRVRITTRDRWSLGVDGQVWGFTGKIAGEIYDESFLGLGNEFNYRLSLDWKTGKYEGSMFGYEITNLFGTFYEGLFQVGRSFDRKTLNARINKKLIFENDYEIGLEASSRDVPFYFLDQDAGDTVRYWDYDLWGGISRRIHSSESNFYAMARLYDLRYRDRDRIYLHEQPIVIDADNNPYLHNRTLLLGSVGLYSEKFFTDNLIYQFGRKENIYSGYKVELTGGYMWGEYHNGVYGSLSLMVGGYTGIGYLMGRVSLGSLYSTTIHHLYQSTANLQLTYFSNLVQFRRTQARFFLSVNFLDGLNRTHGANEAITFTRESGPRSFRQHLVGQKRFVLSSEAVFFTPWEPVGFRVAMYGYLDAGFLGYHSNMFRNNFYSSFGVGIRLRNERLVFSAIQLRLGLALGKGGWIKSNWIYMNTRQALPDIRFMPQKPQIDRYE